MAWPTFISLWRFCVKVCFTFSPICGHIQVKDTLLRFSGSSSADEVFTLCCFRTSRKKGQIGIPRIFLCLCRSSPRGRWNSLCLPFHCLQRLLEKPFNNSERDEALLWMGFGEYYYSQKSILQINP